MSTISLNFSSFSLNMGFVSMSFSLSSVLTLSKRQEPNLHVLHLARSPLPNSVQRAAAVSPHSWCRRLAPLREH
eukprot:7446696-Pyramimonas_sp.AAC.1